MKTVTICGSMKIENEMRKIAFILETEKNMNVLQCVYNTENKELSEDDICALEAAHYRKIELSDAIYVVDINGYIGSSVSKEISFAEAHKKDIIFHSQHDLHGSEAIC